jgi:FixJ family two-component response regulator
MPGSKEEGTVIIVEDDPSMCQALDRILRLGGFFPLMYCSAEAYLDDSHKSDAICLILDVQLPGMDGFALHDRLAASGRVPPVIFITAFDEPEARVRVSSVRAAAFLPKPFDGRVLLNTVRSAVERKNGAHDSQREG